MAQSRDACQVTGIYDSDCECRRAVFLIPGDRFPLCPRCGGMVNWRTVWTLILERPRRPRRQRELGLVYGLRREGPRSALWNGWDEV